MNAIGTSDFYELDISSKKKILFILQMSNKSRKLSGMGFFELELEKFTAVRKYIKFLIRSTALKSFRLYLLHFHTLH